MNKRIPEIFRKAFRSALFGICIGLASEAAAAPKPETGAARPKESTSENATTESQSRSGRKAPAPNVPKAEELEALVIEGKVMKPEVFYVLSRSEPKYTDVFHRQSFVSHVLDSIKAPIF